MLDVVFGLISNFGQSILLIDQMLFKKPQE